MKTFILHTDSLKQKKYNFGIYLICAEDEDKALQIWKENARSGVQKINSISEVKTDKEAMISLQEVGDIVGCFGTIR